MTTSSIDPRRLAKHHSRKRVNAVALALALGAMAFGVFWLIWILVETVRLGFGGLALATFTEMTPAPMPVATFTNIRSSTPGQASSRSPSAMMLTSLSTSTGTPKCSPSTPATS